MRRRLVARAVSYALMGSAMAGCTRYEYREPECPPEEIGDTTLVVAAEGSPDHGSPLDGQVVDSRSRAPLRGSQVMLVAGPDTFGAIADTAGRFEIDGEAEGSAVMTVALLGYHVRTDTLEFPRDTGLNVIVPLRVMVVDGCPGFARIRVPKPWWKLW